MTAMSRCSPHVQHKGVSTISGNNKRCHFGQTYGKHTSAKWHDFETAVVQLFDRPKRLTIIIGRHRQKSSYESYESYWNSPDLLRSLSAADADRQPHFSQSHSHNPLSLFRQQSHLLCRHQSICSTYCQTIFTLSIRSTSREYNLFR